MLFRLLICLWLVILHSGFSGSHFPVGLTSCPTQDGTCRKTFPVAVPNGCLQPQGAVAVLACMSPDVPTPSYLLCHSWQPVTPPLGSSTPVLPAL